MKNKILAIGDIHDKIDILIEVLFKVEKDYPIVCILGDFFDSFTETATKDAQKTARWLKENLYNPKYVFLYGNHDLHYRYSNCLSIRGSGYSGNKAKEINRILSNDDWNQFKFYYQAQGFVFSHAGFNNNLLHPIKGFHKEFIDNNINNELKIIQRENRNAPLMRQEKALNGGTYYENDYSCYQYFGVGCGRGGSLDKGGFLWQDWGTEFTPVEGINQIVGHSYSDNIQYKNYNNSVNVNIDCFPNYVLEIENGALKEIKIKT